MQRFMAFVVFFTAIFAVPAFAQNDPAPGTDELPPELVEFLEQLDPQTGVITLPSARATLDLGEDYIFYDAEDAGEILVTLWGNPPQNAEGILGMVMPAGSTPISDEWGAIITFEESGYVSDDDAADTDYDELLEMLQDGTDAGNAERTAAGYAAIDLVGWAERPNYDSSQHSVVWAQNLAFADTDVNTLNYDVRTLGRYGVLSINLISTMPELGEIRVAANDFASHASFDLGARYQDFDPVTDRVADYGIGGLIAGGVGAAVAKKAGVFAVLLKFLKPILIGLGALLAVFGRKIMSFFGRGKEEEYDEEWENYVEEETGATDASEDSENAEDAETPSAEPPNDDGEDGLDDDTQPTSKS